MVDRPRAVEVTVGEESSHGLLVEVEPERRQRLGELLLVDQAAAVLVQTLEQVRVRVRVRVKVKVRVRVRMHPAP